MILRALAILLAFLLMSCGTRGLKLEYDTSVPADQKTMIQEDMDFLASQSLPYHSRFKQFSITDSSGPGLSRWLSERMKIIVGLSYGGNQESNVIMNNYGGTKYKSNMTSLSINGRDVSVTSPRVGIIQIGPALFSNSGKYNSKEPNGLKNRMSRIATYLHEARHSDGNTSANSLCFSHSQCPSGHNMASQYACESTENGAYNLSGIVLTQFYVSCQNCTANERNLLLLEAYDQFNRTLPNPQVLDDAPEYRAL